MKKVIALQATKHSYKTVPIFLKQAEKSGLFDKYYICTDQQNPGGLNDKCILHRIDDLGYSSNMISLMNIVEEELVFVILEDFILRDDLNTKLINQCFQFMLNTPDAGLLRMRVGGAKYRNKLFKRQKGLCCPVIKKHKHYICLQPGIWRKSFLLYCFRKGENAWASELKGRDRGRKNPNFICYSTTKTVLSSENFLVKGHPTAAYIDYLLRNNLSFKHFGKNPQIYDRKKKTRIPLIKYLNRYRPWIEYTKKHRNWKSMLT